jgi:hypothetical protein
MEQKNQYATRRSTMCERLRNQANLVHRRKAMNQQQFLAGWRELATIHTSL